MSLSRKTRRARLSMTSLIDVIFLLLLFFMLSSTFSRFAEVELTAAGTGAPDPQDAARTHFLRLADGTVSFNGQPVEAAALTARLNQHPRPATVLVSVTGTAQAQLLTDVLVALREVPKLSIAVLGAS